MNKTDIYGKYGYSMNFCSRIQYSKKQKTEIICASSFDGYLHSCVCIDNKILAILIDYKLKVQSNKPLQIRNKIIAERIDASVSGVKKAFNRLEELGLIKRTFYLGKYRNIFLNMDLIDKYCSEFATNEESELYNIKTPSEIKKVKHGGFSRIDITRRRILRDLLHSKRISKENNKVTEQKAKKGQYLAYLKMQLNKRRYYKEETTINKLLGNLKYNKGDKAVKPYVVDPIFEDQVFKLIATFKR